MSGDATQAPLIELKRAAVRFGSADALLGIDLSLCKGERVALVGANGCGKTTLLRVLHGVQSLSTGARHVAAQAQRQAMVFQRPFMLRRSALANVELGLKLAGVPRPSWAARANEALRRVGLSAQALQQATDLSGGQQQRLALARAWALEPELLLLDEPTASLDPSAKREIETLVSEFAESGATVVMASHNLGQVKRMAHRVIYLERGRVLADVPTDRFFNGDVPLEAAHFLKGELPW